MSDRGDAGGVICRIKAVKSVYYRVAFALLGIRSTDDVNPTEEQVNALLRSGTLTIANLEAFCGATGLDQNLVLDVVECRAQRRGRFTTSLRAVRAASEVLPIDEADRLVRLARLVAYVIHEFGEDPVPAKAWLEEPIEGAICGSEGAQRIALAATEPGCGMLLYELYATRKAR